MPDHDHYSLRPLLEEDLRKVLEWRNSERVRAFMYTDHVISWEEHCAWYGRVKESEAAEVLISEHLGKPAGLVNFSDINLAHSRCLWGFYLGERNLPRGSGTVMGLLALDYIFEERGARKVSGEVLDTNAASRRFFRRLGFQEEGRLRQHVLKNGRLADVIIYS